MGSCLSRLVAASLAFWGALRSTLAGDCDDVGTGCESGFRSACVVAGVGGGASTWLHRQPAIAADISNRISKSLRENSKPPVRRAVDGVKQKGDQRKPSIRDGRAAVERRSRRLKALAA